MALGEHLRIQVGGRYDHAIDCGDHTVLHLAMSAGSGRPEVRRSLLLDFTQGAERVDVLRHRERTYPARVVVGRAFSKLGDSAAWAMFPSPAHFVTWCLTGQAPIVPTVAARPLPARRAPAARPRRPAAGRKVAKPKAVARPAGKPKKKAPARKASAKGPAARKASPKKKTARFPPARKAAGKKVAARRGKAKRSR